MNENFVDSYLNELQQEEVDRYCKCQRISLSFAKIAAELSHADKKNIGADCDLTISGPYKVIRKDT
ncbi:hypothetical protein [Endozoicomonas sp. 8E]|uniref:hypothetical protein n=1 Tax=Endozoicomonas sp. 8E TaxID=3035692 RepID=UPI002939193B|nr:hypothetical protein [Endozoicomonas sp. 8E]WOG25401.1 hypothetical protein P6910_12440 [Endozoicomonas sp. 8E]